MTAMSGRQAIREQDAGQPQELGLTPYERYEGGGAEAERVLFDRLAHELMEVQAKLRKVSGSAEFARTFHAKQVLGVQNAVLEVNEDLPEELRVGRFAPGASYPATVRLSNASGVRQADFVPDLRGVALRIRASAEESYDLLMTNYPVSHAKDAREFVAFAKAMAGANTRLRRSFAALIKLPLTVGPATAFRMLRNVTAGSRHTVRSLALESYWSRGAILWGDAGPVRYLLRPAPGAPPAADPSGSPDYLSRELGGRLSNGDVVFELCLQRFVDERQTPIEDGSVEWKRAVAPPIPVASVRIPAQDFGSVGAAGIARQVEELVFNPWCTTDEFRPLGNMNRARKAAYTASSAQRLGFRFTTHEPLRNRLLDIPVQAVFETVNTYIPWHKLPMRLSLLNLAMLRQVLRKQNLIDTQVHEAPPKAMPVPKPVDEQLRVRRSYNGEYNDLSDPKMGAVGAAFGRNLEPHYRPDLFGTPNPVAVSNTLLVRERFLPATSLNILAAAWIQFQVHDWVVHQRYPAGTKNVEVPLPSGQSWHNTPGGPAEQMMRFAENEGLDPGPGRPPILFGNTVSHWWDGSEVYGGTESLAKSLRVPGGGGLHLEDGHLPIGENGIPITGFTESWWLGISVMHTLFAREHNAVCDALRAEYPAMSEDRIYHTARLVVAALIAKIHTIEWTPAILGTKTIDIALRTNWEGPPKNWLTQLGLWLLEAHSLTGIPSTLPEHFGVPYSLTEDFVTVYRMHPLLPDDYELRDHSTGEKLATLGFNDMQGRATEALFRKTGMARALYSFGIAHPGAIRLNNFPEALRRFERDGELIDLAVVDIVRSRRRGVPRYNDFRAGLHKQRIRSFEELTSDAESVARLRAVYSSVDEIDTMVGLFAENPPEGFGFSDTAFRIFILMASRRLQSDRFLTVDFRPEIYTPLGMDWVARNGMKSVVLRHCPQLAGVLPRNASAFAPWRPIPSE